MTEQLQAALEGVCTEDQAGSAFVPKKRNRKMCSAMLDGAGVHME